MWNEVFSLVLKNGIWTTLFVVLLFYVLKDSAKREQKYQNTIQELSKNLGVVMEIKSQVEKIEKTIEKKTEKEIYEI